jgi:hypothetical protein
VLPIPNGVIGKYPGNGIKFSEIPIKPDYLNGVNAINLENLITRLAEKRHLPRKTSEKIHDKCAHFDPWLGPCPWLAEVSNHHLGAFGQESAAQSHLHNQKVKEGSLFLFFSRFKPIENRKWDDKYLGISYKHAKEGLYFIYGWLRVKELVTKYGSNPDLENHPHYTKEYFEKYPPEKEIRNTIYLSGDCGYFPELNNELLLTANEKQQTKQCVTWIPSRWSLKPCFYKSLTHTNDKQWTPVDEITKTCMVALACPQ